jgi:hypothetical protein
MWKTGIVRKGKVGNTKIMSVDLKDVIKCVDDMAERGVFFYDLT